LAAYGSQARRGDGRDSDVRRRRRRRRGGEEERRRWTSNTGLPGKRERERDSKGSFNSKRLITTPFVILPPPWGRERELSWGKERERDRDSKGV
jgi:hypothetical protein